MTRTLHALCVVLAVAAGPGARAASGDASLLDFVATHGCVISPTTQNAAVAHGFTAEDLQALRTRAQAHRGSEMQGDWLVIAPELCQIRMPKIGAVEVSDAELRAHAGAPDEWAAEGLAGCFLYTPGLNNHLVQKHGWGQATADRELVRFLAQAIIGGRLAFYSDDPLATPPGFMLTDGSCDVSPLLPMIRSEAAAVEAHFDAILRDVARSKVCREGETFLGPEFIDATERASGQEMTNAWGGFQMDIIVMAAGWVEGSARVGRGTPRPPLCHYQD